MSGTCSGVVLLCSAQHEQYVVTGKPHTDGAEVGVELVHVDSRKNLQPGGAGLGDDSVGVDSRTI